MRKETGPAFPVSRIVRGRTAAPVLALAGPAALFSGTEVNLEAGLFFVCLFCLFLVEHFIPWESVLLGQR